MSHYTNLVRNNGMTGNFATVQAAIGGALVAVDALLSPLIVTSPLRVLDLLSTVLVSGTDVAPVVNLVWTRGLPVTGNHPVDLAAVAEAAVRAQVSGSSVTHGGSALPASLAPASFSALATALGF